ncbi:MAG: RsfS/YbeB/iojap family protein, partial [Leptonema sp. (in: Bacteria)]|nr:RsfS/YbeB/iojap family protein [Leptonema sp. (in: bacteria)]
QLLDKKVRPIDVESGWIIHDFVDIMLHLFLDEQRQFYNLEKLWGDAPVIYSEEQPKFQWPLLRKTKAE